MAARRPRPDTVGSSNDAATGATLIDPGGASVPLAMLEVDDLIALLMATDSLRQS